MRPPVSRQDADGKAVADRTIPRIVVRDGRHAGREILQTTDEQPIGQGKAGVAADGWIGLQARPEVVNPVVGVRVTIAPLEWPEVIQFEMIVRVDEPGNDKRALEVDDLIA